jgi:hypothetical protein
LHFIEEPTKDDDVGVAVFNRVRVNEMLVALVVHQGEE